MCKFRAVGGFKNGGGGLIMCIICTLLVGIGLPVMFKPTGVITPPAPPLPVPTALIVVRQVYYEQCTVQAKCTYAPIQKQA